MFTSQENNVTVQNMVQSKLLLFSHIANFCDQQTASIYLWSAGCPRFTDYVEKHVLLLKSATYFDKLLQLRYPFSLTITTILIFTSTKNFTLTCVLTPRSIHIQIVKSPLRFMQSSLTFMQSSQLFSVVPDPDKSLLLPQKP